MQPAFHVTRCSLYANVHRILYTSLPSPSLSLYMGSNCCRHLPRSHFLLAQIVAYQHDLRRRQLLPHSESLKYLHSNPLRCQCCLLIVLVATAFLVVNGGFHFFCQCLLCYCFQQNDQRFLEIVSHYAGNILDGPMMHYHVITVVCVANLAVFPLFLSFTHTECVLRRAHPNAFLHHSAAARRARHCHENPHKKKRLR